MRKIAITLGIIVVVIVVGATFFLATFDVNKYRGTIQSQIEKRIGRPVTLGDMHLKVFPPRFAVQDLSIADDPRFSPDAPFVKAKELDVSIKLLPLLHKQIEIDSLNLAQPNVNLIKNQGGQWNFASLGHGPEIAGNTPSQQPTTTPKNTGKSKPAQPETSAQPNAGATRSAETKEQQFSLGELTIQDGQISLLDQTQSKTPSLYNHIDVTLKNFAMNSPFTVDATVHMAGAGAQDLKLQGQGGPLVEQDLSKTPFHGTLELKQVGIGDFTKFLNSPALNGTDGVMSGQTRINNDSGKLTAEGETDIQNVKVRGMELGYPVSVQYDLTDEMPTEVITVRKLTMKLGSTPLEMTGTLETKSTPAHIDVNLRANNVSVA